MNNNIIPACIIGAGLFAVALKPAPQPAPIPQAEPVAVATASVTGPSEPVIVWYSTIENAWDIMERRAAYRTRELGLMGQLKLSLGETPLICNRFVEELRNCHSRRWLTVKSFLTSDWQVISSPQMACRTDINGNGEIEFGDLLAVLNQWGDQATCPDTVQLQCGLGTENSSTWKRVMQMSRRCTKIIRETYSVGFKSISNL